MSGSTATPLTLEVDLLPAFSNMPSTFSGWNTSRDGSGVAYADGYVFSFKSDLNLFAQWTTKTVDTISFSANGGNGSISSISVSPGSTLTLPSQSGLIRAGFAITSWNTEANGSGAKYIVGQQMTVSESTLLYAQWSGHKPSILFGAIGTFKSNSSSLSTALKSHILRLARTIKLKQFRTITLYGYSAATGLKSLNVALSRTRAHNVGVFLRHELANLRIRGVSISSAGEGAIAGQVSNEYSRVEVFGF
jgi:outer membrane protein OmpA-like peptidoglycan-associated protein